MKKSIVILIISAIVIGGAIWWYMSSNANNNNQAQNNRNNEINYQAEKSASNVNSENNKTDNTTNNTSTIQVQKQETEIANFTTKIYNKDEERQNNIGITCKALTSKEIRPGETFSFCETVGKSTTEKGYQEADIYVEGEKKQGLGGGNCQVSTTLYNAVVQIPELEIVERHLHSGHVPYIEEGKDAAVAYGSYDFKFKNNTQDVIKIVMDNNNDNITAKIIKIS